MTDLTEQWKKGELPFGEYWCKVVGSPYIERVMSDCMTDEDIVEILDKVPSYNKWSQLNEVIKRTKASGNYPSKVSQYKVRITALTEEKQQLNERLLDMIDLLQKCYFYLNAVADGKVKTEHLEQIKTLAILIDNAIGEKK